MRALYLALWIAFFLTAANSANNLFYLVFSLLTGFIAASHIVAGRTLSGLSCQRVFPAKIFAGSPASVPALISSRDGEAKFMLSLADESGQASECPSSCFFVAPGRGHSTKISYNFPKRGLVPVPALKVRSEMPFLLWEKSFGFDPETMLVVFPETVRIRIGPGVVSRRVRRSASALNVSSDEFLSFKEYSAGDPIHKINWRHYTISRSLVVPKYEELNSCDYALLLLLPDSSPAGSHVYESALSAASSVAAALNEAGLDFDAITSSGNLRRVNCRHSGIDRLLTHIAILEENYRFTRPAIRRAAAMASVHESVIVISAGAFEGIESIPAYLGARLKAMIVMRDPEPGAAPGSRCAPAPWGGPAGSRVFEADGVEAIKAVFE